MAPRLFLVWLLGVLLIGCARPRSDLAVPGWSMSVAGGLPSAVTLPAHLDAVLPDAATTYELKATVVLPEALRGHDLVFAIPDFLGLGALTANGAYALALDESTFDRYRRSHPLRFRIPAASTRAETLDLVLTVQHRWSHSGWIDSVPILADAAVGTPELVAADDFNRTAAIAAFATASFVALLYGYLAAALSGSRRRTFGLFALGSILNVSYPALLLGITQPLLGVYDVPVGTWLLVAGAVCATYFAKAYFEMRPPHAGWKWFVGVAGVIALLARDPFHALRVVGPLVIVATMANTLMQLALVVKLRHQRPRRKNLYLISLAWPMTAVLGVTDFNGWMGMTDTLRTVRTACVGMTVISLLQAFALLRDHLRSLAHADKLNAELASRVDALEAKRQEVELLNDELRRQIAARSRQLADTLAKGDGTMEVPRFRLTAGDVIESRYRVVRLLGEGGMGAVHEVERVSDGKHFAMKLLSVVNDPVARARFAREAQIAANVKHTNVVSLVDFDVAREGFLFLVMELVEGATLREVRKRALDVPWTLFVLAQVAEGLDAIHAQGIVHRDLKPANVLLSRGSDGRRPLVKITDFGVSSLLAEEFRSQSGLQTATPVADDSDLLPPVSVDPDRAAPVTGTEAEPTRKYGRTDPPVNGTVASDRRVAPRNSSNAGSLATDTGAPTRLEPVVPSRIANSKTALRQEGTAFSAVNTPSAPPAARETPDGPSPATQKPRQSLPANGTPRASTRASMPATHTPRGPAPYPHVEDQPLTRPGIVFGTPNYMAAELVDGKATRAADIFSLGVIAFELMTLRRPFEECPLRAAIKNRVLVSAPPLRDVVPGLDPLVADLLDRALTHDPSQRPTARDLADAFRDASNRGLSASR